MYVPHFAVALAVHPRARRAPLWALLTGAFLPDLAWIALARAGVEPASDAAKFWDDWSHSLVSVFVMATLYAACFWRRGRVAMLGLWIAVASHFLLDFPVHPKLTAFYPHSALHLGSDAWLAWGNRIGWLGMQTDWWLQFLLLLALLAIYVQGSLKTELPRNLMWASCLFLVALQCLTLAPCIGY